MSTLKLDTLSNKAGTASVPSDTIVSGTAKAWVKFNGTGTVAIQNSFNVSSITDVTTGQYNINFSNAMPSAEYCAIGCSGYDTTYTGDSGHNSINTRGTTSTYVWMINWNDGDVIVDCGQAHVAIFS